MADRMPGAPRVVVIGDLLLDVVLAPTSSVERAADVVGEIELRQGGSAATTARWLARLGLDASLITSVGRDNLGDSLISHMEHCQVQVHASRPPRVRTGRMGVLLDQQGERSFIADRRAAYALSVSAVRKAWLVGAQAIHVPAYCLFGEPLASATRYAVKLGRRFGACLSVDLASASFIRDYGSDRVRQEVASLGPDLLFATVAEAQALLGHGRVDELTLLASTAVVKRGRDGATVLVRGDPVQTVDIPTPPLWVADTTGAGDAFAAGFLDVWLRHGPRERVTIRLLASAARAGHRAAARELRDPRPELLIFTPRVNARPPSHLSRARHS